MRSEIATLLSQGVISEVNNTSHDKEEFLANVFLRPKPNNDFRMVLNLTHLNRFVECRHFKMEGLTSALNMLKPGVFMASVDLRKAYFSCPIAREHRRCLRSAKSLGAKRLRRAKSLSLPVFQTD